MIIFIGNDNIMSLYKIIEGKTQELVNCFEFNNLLETDEIDFKGVFYQEFMESFLVVLSDGQVLKFDDKLDHVDSLYIEAENIIKIISNDLGELFGILLGKGDLIILNKDLEIEQRTSLLKDIDNNEIIEASMSWRFDYEFLSVVVKTSKGSKALVFNRNLEAIKTTSLYHKDYPLVKTMFEFFDKELLCLNIWNSSGSLCYGVREYTTDDNSKEIKIQNWEKNGLQYKEFKVDQKLKITESVQFIQINNQGLILVLSIHDNESNQNSLLFFYRSNSEFYLQNEYTLKGQIINLLFFKNELYVLTNKQLIVLSYFIHTSIFNYSKIENQFNSVQNALGICCQNKTLKITPYDSFMIPSPMSLIMDNVSKNCSLICSSQNYIFVLYSSGELDSYQYIFPRGLIKNNLVQIYETDMTPLSFKSIVKNESIYLYGTGLIKKGDLYSNVVWNSQLVIKDKKIEYIYFTTIDIPEENSIIATCIYDNSFLIQLNDQKWRRLNEDQKKLLNMSLEFSTHGKIFINFDFVKINQITYLIGITDKNELWLNDKIICENCTSFSLSNNYLIFITSTQIPYDHLHTYSLQYLTANPTLRLNAKKYSDDSDPRLRNVEKNAKIICCVKEKVVLRMPRGNLESFANKILLIKNIIELVQDQKYKEAMTEVRKHKLSSNLLTDVDFDNFISSVKSKKFIESLSGEHLDLFINDLKEDFCPILQYILLPFEITNAESSINKNIVLTDVISDLPKVQFICNILESAMMDDIGKNILHLLVVYSKMSPPALEKGLEVIKKIQLKESNASSTPKIPHVNHMLTDTVLNQKSQFKDSLKYFCWLVNAEKLYNLSLSIYDLELSLLIAEFTNMDPREYIPYTDQLKSITRDIERKAKICIDLKLHDKAVEEYAKGNEEEKNKAIELVIINKNYISGIKVFQNDKNRLEVLKNKFGQHLFENKNYKQACVFLFENKENKSMIIQCCEKTYDWKLGYKFLEVHKFEKNEIAEFLGKMSKLYLKFKLYKGLTKIMRKQNESLDKIVEVLLKDKLFKKVRILIENRILTEKEKIDIQHLVSLSLISEISVLRKKCNDIRYWEKRLTIVQEIKKNAFENNEEQLFDENMSMTSEYSQNTVMSGIESDSAYSKISSVAMQYKSKNKRPKNLLSRKLKENSIYEEEWLVGTLNKEVSNEDNLKNYYHLMTLAVKCELITQFSELKSLLKELYN